jgi:hypothetical protein
MPTTKSVYGKYAKLLASEENENISRGGAPYDGLGGAVQRHGVISALADMKWLGGSVSYDNGGNNIMSLIAGALLGKTSA